jgi:hypothetical protein
VACRTSGDRNAPTLIPRKAQDPGQLLQRDLCFAQVAQRDLLANVFPQDLEGGAFGFQMPLQGARSMKSRSRRLFAMPSLE